MKLDGSAAVPLRLWEAVIAYLLGEVVRTARKQAGLNRNEAAARLGLTAAELAVDETGGRLPSVGRLADLSELYGTTPTKVFDAVVALLARGGVRLDKAELDLAVMSASTNAHLHPARDWAQQWLRDPAYRSYTVVSMNLAARSLLARVCGLDENGA